MRLHRVLPLVSLALTACTGNGADDSGDFPFERGCITVDGAGGYMWLADALSQADQGSTVELCNGVITESIAIDKSLSIVGNGMGRSVWAGPTNEPTITVAPDVELHLEGLTVRSSRSGLEAEGATVELVDVHFDQVGNYAVDALDSTVTASGIEITGTGWGGLWIKGGSLTLSDALIEDATGFGVRAEGAAVATLTGNTIRSSRYTGDGSEGDGFGVHALGGADVTMVDNVLESNVIGGVKVESSSLSLTGGSMTDNYSGLWIDQALSLDVSNVQILQSYQYGLVLLSSHDATLDGVDIITDPEISAQHTEEYDGSYGVIAIDSDLSFSNGTISGHNTAGLLNQANLTTGISTVLSSVEITDNGRLGLATLVGSLDATDVTVSATRNDESCVDEFGSYACNFNVLLNTVEATWTGGAIRDGEGFGAVVFGGSLEMSDALVATNEEYGIYAQNAAFTTSGTTFEAPGNVGVYLSGSYGTFIDGTFKDNSGPITYEWSDGYKSVYHYSSTDIAAASKSTVTLRNTTFAGGDQAIDGFDSTLDLEDVSFTGYNARALDLYQGTATLARTTFEDIGSKAIDCSNATLQAEDLTIRRITRTLSKSQEFDDAGELISEYESSSIGPALEGWGCTFDLEDIIVEDTTGRAIDLVDTKLELDGGVLRDLVKEKAGDHGAINATWSTGAADLWMNDVSIENVVAGHGLRITGQADAADAVAVEQLVISGTSGDGVKLTDLNGVAIDGLEIGGASGAGLSGTRIVATVDGTAGGATGTITGSGKAGVLGRGGALTLRNLTVDGAGGSGIDLVGGAHTLEAVTATDATAYGMSCAADEEAELPAPTFESCTSVSVDGAAGVHDGCGACITE